RPPGKKRAKKRKRNSKWREEASCNPCEIDWNGFSHTVGDLYHLIGATEETDSLQGPIRCACNSCTCEAPTHCDYLSRCDRDIRWPSFSTTSFAHIGFDCFEYFLELLSFHCEACFAGSFYRSRNWTESDDYSIRHRNGNNATGSDAKQSEQKDVLPLKIVLGTHVRSSRFESIYLSNSTVNSLSIQVLRTSLSTY
ncbi:unnamed protein product, partial [Heterotrigona itama]